MNREELLKALGLSSEEFHDLLKKFDAFFSSLNKNQQVIVRRSLPTVAQALSALRPDVSEAELEKFFASDDLKPPMCFFWAGPPPR